MLQIFYDAQCELCSALSEMVYNRDPHQRVVFTDLNQEAPFLQPIYGIDPEEARRVVHGIDEIGTIYSGFDLVLRLAEILDYKWFSRFFSLPVFKQVGAGGFWLLSQLRKI